jgi:hypothetical protein
MLNYTKANYSGLRIQRPRVRIPPGIPKINLSAVGIYGDLFILESVKIHPRVAYTWHRESSTPCIRQLKDLLFRMILSKVSILKRRLIVLMAHQFLDFPQ